MNAKSWKTTMFAVLAVLPQVAMLLKWITLEQSTALSIVLASVGIGLSKDHNISGNPAINIDEPDAPKTVTQP